MSSPFVSPDVVAPLPKRAAGGDNEIERDSKGRPRIIVFCDVCDKTGRVPSEKRPGNTVQCKKCAGVGHYTRSYTRTTTFIDVLDDKSNLQKWGERNVLIGVAIDPSFLEQVPSLTAVMNSADMDCKHTRAERSEPNHDCASCRAKEAKDALTRKAESAKVIAGSEEKADKGTFLHGLSELVDEGEPLPDGITFGDVIDMDDYRNKTRWLHIVHMEQLVVNDQYWVAGTPDRVSTIRDWHGPLEAPDGSVIEPGELLITDLKTGSVEYGALKMAMQLSLYSRSKLYNKKTGERTPLERINQKWGIIMHLPAGQGDCTLYWANLTLGWKAVELAYEVREIRKQGRNALVQIAPEGVSTSPLVAV